MQPSRRRSRPDRVAITGDLKLAATLGVACAHVQENEPNGLLVGAAARPCNTRYGDTNVGAERVTNALRHRLRDFRGHGAVRLEQCVAHAKRVTLHSVVVRHNATQKRAARTGYAREALADHAASARFRARDAETPVEAEAVHDALYGLGVTREQGSGQCLGELRFEPVGLRSCIVAGGNVDVYLELARANADLEPAVLATGGFEGASDGRLADPEKSGAADV